MKAKIELEHGDTAEIENAVFEFRAEMRDHLPTEYLDIAEDALDKLESKMIEEIKIEVAVIANRAYELGKKD